MLSFRYFVLMVVISLGFCLFRPFVISQFVLSLLLHVFPSVFLSLVQVLISLFSDSFLYFVRQFVLQLFLYFVLIHLCISFVMSFEWYFVCSFVRSLCLQFRFVMSVFIYLVLAFFIQVVSYFCMAYGGAWLVPLFLMYCVLSLVRDFFSSLFVRQLFVQLFLSVVRQFVSVFSYVVISSGRHVFIYFV